jgi:truncated hemoglobin YjbI/ketosteroid isomerase-like protein
MNDTAALYNAIGGEAAVAAAVDRFYDRVRADPRLAPFFAGMTLQRLKTHQRAFLTQALGGPAMYGGRGMRTAHAGLGLGDAHFDRVINHLRDALTELGVSTDLVTRVIAGLEPLRSEIAADNAGDIMQTRNLSRDAMDRLMDAHFQAEVGACISEIVATFTDDVEHEIVGVREPIHGKEGAGALYTGLLKNLVIDQITPVRRLHGDDFLVDESILEGRAMGQVAGLEGHGRPVRFRLLHIFEFRDGLIARENAWLDLAAIQQQLT